MTMDLDGRVERLEQLLKVTPLDTDDSVIARFDEIRRFHAEIHRLWAGADGRKRMVATLTALYEAGWTLEEIARTGGFSSRERVRQIIKAAADRRAAAGEG
jgi:DNA-directed RNA polymerase sigma subunit (sigma70/sigma32)